jgi:adenylate/guanylate cyclase family protein
MERARYQYHSLDDFLTSRVASVDGVLDDGWGATFPVKGREIEATIMFADITGFSRRSLNLSPTESLIFVNNFFTWVTAEALRGRHGIIDKYIGDEMMLVFSKEFGSEDPFTEAVEAARAMSQYDAHSFNPHVGIASGLVTVGYVGTPMKYNCSAFGAPVVLASRLTGCRPSEKEANHYSTSIAFPAKEWGDRSFERLFPPRRLPLPDGATRQDPTTWELLPPRMAPLKNLPELSVQLVVNRGLHFPSISPEDRAREALAELRKAGRYWPREPEA